MENRIKALEEALNLERNMRSKVEKELEFYKYAINAMPNPVFIKNQELQFVFFNKAYKEFFGLKEGENIGKKVEDLPYLTEEKKKKYKAEDTKMLEELSVIQYETSFCDNSSHEDRECLYWSKGFLAPGVNTRGLVGEIVDISFEKQIQKDLSRSMSSLKVLMRDAKTASNTDILTKLYNRNILETEIPDFVENTKNMGQPISMMLIDIDYFKQINDQLGHLHGDDILRKFGEVLRKTFRQKDIAIRYGGDEFMMLLPGASAKETEEMANRFRKAICENLGLASGECVTLSIGITAVRQEDTMESFIARADEALYAAKKMGRDRAIAIV